MPAFTHYKTITIDRSQCGAVNASNFPLALVLTHADLKTVANGGKVTSSSGYDIRPYDIARTTALDFELVAYDGATGAVEMYVRVPTLNGSSAGSDTTLALVFGNSAITTDGTSTATWRAEYKAVLHLKDSAASTTVRDSTSNANHGTNAVNTSGKSITGQLGKGLTYNGTSDLTTLPNIPALHSVNQISFSTWVKFTAFSDYAVIMSESDPTASLRFGHHLGGPGAGVNTGVLLVFGEAPGAGSSFAFTAGGIFSTGVWYHVVSTYDTSQATNATRAHVYINGVDRALTFNSGYSPVVPIAPGTDPIRLAKDGGGTGFSACSLDEARAYAGVLAPSWVTAEYNNQRTQTGTGDFIALGATTSVPTDYAGLVALDGASGYWPLDELAGSTIARDRAGSRNGTLSGGVVAGRRGLWGRAMEFNGDSAGAGRGHIDLGAGPPAPAGSFTIDLWCFDRTTITRGHTFWAKGTLAPPVARPDTPGVLAFGIISSLSGHHLTLDSNGPTSIFASATSTLPYRMWCHVACAYTLGVGVRFYLNGVPDGDAAMTCSVDNTLPTWIGDYPYFPDQGYGWEGLLQAVAWYPTALTDAQIAQHYAVGVAQASARQPLSVLQLADDDDEDDMLKYNIVTPITASDSADLPRLTDAIYVGSDGDVSVMTQGGTTARVFTNVVGGSILPVVAKRVNASGTTATALLALYRG